MYQFREGWKETTFIPPDIANHEDWYHELGKITMKCHRCKKEFNNLKETIYIEKDKLRCKSCECQLTKENTEEYIKRTNTEN